MTDSDRGWSGKSKIFRTNNEPQISTLSSTDQRVPDAGVSPSFQFALAQRPCETRERPFSASLKRVSAGPSGWLDGAARSPLEHLAPQAVLSQFRVMSGPMTVLGSYGQPGRTDVGTRRRGIDSSALCCVANRPRNQARPATHSHNHTTSSGTATRAWNSKRRTTATRPPSLGIMISWCSLLAAGQESGLAAGAAFLPLVAATG